MIIDILLQAQAIPGIMGAADYAIGTAIPYIFGAIGTGATGAWIKNHWQDIKNAAGKHIVRPVFGSERKYIVRSNPMVAQSDATRVFRPVVVPTRRDIDVYLGGIRAIPVYGKQSGISTPVMGKKKKARKARPIITRTQNEESTSVPVGSGAIARPEDTLQRDTVRVTNGAAVENSTPQDTVKVQHENTENTEQTTDNRNILQRLGDRLAKRKAKNNSTTNPENKPPRNWRDKIKTVGKWGMYGFVANEADNKFFGGRVKKIVKGVLDLGFDKPDTVYIEKPNNVQRLQTTINTPEQVIGYPTEKDYK